MEEEKKQQWQRRQQQRPGIMAAPELVNVQNGTVPKVPAARVHNELVCPNEPVYLRHRPFTAFDVQESNQFQGAITQRLWDDRLSEAARLYGWRWSQNRMDLFQLGHCEIGDIFSGGKRTHSREVRTQFQVYNRKEHIDTLCICWAMPRCVCVLLFVTFAIVSVYLHRSNLIGIVVCIIELNRTELRDRRREKK